MFRHATIGRKMAFMLLIPILALLLTASTGVWQRWHIQREATAMHEPVQLALAMSTFVHEAQKERGLTGGFMGSQGKKFRDELITQRLVTDKRVAELNTVLLRFEAARFGGKFQQDFDSARQNFYDKLPSHRTAVDALAMPGRDGVGYYTRMNAAFIGVIAQVAMLTTNAELSTLIATYANFLSAKEKTGVERAVLTNAFSRGKFESTDEFQNVIAATTAQDTLLSVFLISATTEQQAFYREKLQGQFVDEVARLRQIAMESLNKPDFGGVEAGHWYAMITGKINLMKEVEDKLASGLLGRVERLQSQARASLLLFVALVLGAISLGMICAYYIARGITRSMAVALQVTEGIAEGALHHTITIHSHDETGRLLLALQSMCEQLQQIVGDVQNAASSVSVAAHEIVQGNSDLSQRTQEQAAALEETASSMEEMTSTVKQNADNARQANQLAASARTQAEAGSEVVSQAVSAMADISRSSKQIADIIGVIDSIAFQTNLLALNAAVEAARAGEQGRGFAVVAAEVRKLAQRSAEAAKEIKMLIVGSVEKVDNGSRLVHASGQALNDIVTSVKQVSDIVAEIAAAGREQAAGIDQVNKAVMQMDEMTQQNAALVEQATAASESVDTQTQHLQHLMGFFRMRTSPAEPQRREAVAVPAPQTVGQPHTTREVHLPGQPGQASPTSSLATAAGTPARAGHQASPGGKASHRRDDSRADKTETAHDWVEF